MFTSFARISAFRVSARSLPVVLASGYLLRSRPIFNDSVLAPRQKAQIDIRVKNPVEPVRKRLSYDDLCAGSLTGLFLGILVGKLSTTIAFLSASTYLFLQFLESRNIITIPWRSVIQVGKQKIDLKSMFFDNLSFKISFVSTFLLAAWNI
ncbi:hypothetical protein METBISCDRAFT_26668 [Metschnikowia bicuspidata]|uniref:FUN14-domain-containing protein n=1 Tax=Metschnikowia bicuspidata TaxID=27322 RepID=A0A4P9ZEC0_9ASCO|nr:hypothetical protein METBISCDRAFT_26668 [Metschnikowia bicuspidata]